MQRYANIPGSIEDLNQNEIALTINGEVEVPTREEFYTNYPFFKYWNKDNNERLSTREAINIYVHIPFCIQICDYCFYMKELIKSKDQVNQYVDHLCKEIEMASKTFDLSKRKVNSIYFGGGTPSVLTEVQFRKIMETLHKNHSIEQPEFSFEAEPGTFTKNKLEWYKDCGVNRISMGVQSFDDVIIKLSSRKHTSLQAINSISTIQEVGDFTLNIDLLSGLAGETMSSWNKSLETAIRQKIDMLTIYKMKTYSNTNIFKKAVQGNEIKLPEDQMEISFMDNALNMVLSAGYGMWSTFAFNKEGSEIKYIESSYRGDDMIAYGASSFGKVGKINYQNLNNTDGYFNKIQENKLPIYRTYAMSYKEIIVKELLLCSVRLFSYKKSEFIKKFGFDYFDLIPEVIDELHRKGYITGDTDELVLTRQGILFGDFVSKIISSSVKNVLSKDKIRFVY